FSVIVARQQEGLWFVLPLFLSFMVFLISGFAETNRLPFDLPEAESELVAGYHSEYSAMKFSLFMIAEYAHIVTVSAMVATLFFGGWDIPFTHWDERGGVLQTVATGGVFFVKTFFWIFFVMWIRWTLPRFRYDQLMALGWKILLPLALAYIMVIAVAVQLIGSGLGWTGARAQGLALFALNVLLGWLLFFLLDRGRVVRGVAPRTTTAGERA
ncbi:MAG: complex I subunit 1/NuoH family protein, partial [Gemmatimonadales bacterium]